MTTEKRLAEATALLADMHKELEDRGGTLTRKTWCRLETYVDGLSAAPSPAAEPAPVMVAASNGVPVPCHPEFAAAHAAAPGLWQGAVDAASEPAPSLVEQIAAIVNDHTVGAGRRVNARQCMHEIRDLLRAAREAGGR